MSNYLLNVYNLARKSAELPACPMNCVLQINLWKIYDIINGKDVIRQQLKENIDILEVKVFNYCLKM